jgi:hypothetical protein
MTSGGPGGDTPLLHGLRFRSSVPGYGPATASSRWNRSSDGGAAGAVGVVDKSLRLRHRRAPSLEKIGAERAAAKLHLRLTDTRTARFMWELRTTFSRGRALSLDAMLRCGEPHR